MKRSAASQQKEKREFGNQRVTGLGGIFFRARNPKTLSEWYQKHLGLKIRDNVAIFAWQARQNPKRIGHTVWSVFPHNTNYFGPKNNQFMINYRVKQLDQLMAQLKRERVRLVRKMEKSKYGRFAWITDPEGNRIELWEPPTSYQASEEEIASE